MRRPSTSTSRSTAPTSGTMPAFATDRSTQRPSAISS